MLRSLVSALLAALLVPAFAQDLSPAGETFPKVRLARLSRGPAIVGALGNRLPEVARWYGMTEGQLRSLANRDKSSLLSDQEGRLAYACAGLVFDPALAKAPGSAAGATVQA